MRLSELQIVFAESATKTAERNAHDGHDEHEQNTQKNSGWRRSSDPQPEHYPATDSSRDPANDSPGNGVGFIWNVNQPRRNQGQNRRHEQKKKKYPPIDFNRFQSCGIRLRFQRERQIFSAKRAIRARVKFRQSHLAVRTVHEITESHIEFLFSKIFIAEFSAARIREGRFHWLAV
jgi:hypothetical protein